MGDPDEYPGPFPGQAVNFLHGPDHVLQVFQYIQTVNSVKFVGRKRIRKTIQIVNDIGLGIWAEVYPHCPRHFSIPTANVQNFHCRLNLSSHQAVDPLDIFFSPQQDQAVRVLDDKVPGRGEDEGRGNQLIDGDDVHLVDGFQFQLL